MLQASGDLDLAQEAVGAERGRQLLVQQLDRDGPVMLQVLGEEDRGHAAPAELSLDRVMLDERITQCFQEISHWAAARWRSRSLAYRAVHPPARWPSSLRSCPARPNPY